MNTPKSTLRRWRLNYVITYINSDCANRYRPLILNTLANIAIIHRIDYAIEHEYPIYDEIRNELSKPLQGILADVIYFRASRNSLSSITDFRRLVDLIFQDYDITWRGTPYEVKCQIQKFLPQYPFPEEFCRPKDYPYLEYHKDGQARIVVPASTVEQVVDEMEKEKLN